jgi:hypothetical protein
MRFIATWRHSDGSVVELSERGWKSQDTEKSDWLTTMTDRRSTGFAIPSVIKVWLEENCQLLDVRGSPDQLINISSLLQPVTDIEQPDAGGPAMKKPGRSHSSKRSLQLAKRRILQPPILLRRKTVE